MKTKKILSLFLIVTVVLTQICVSTITVFAANVATINNIRYEYTVSGSDATITKIGYTTSYDGVDIVIPETITAEGTTYNVVAIGNYACNTRPIKTLTMPSVKTVGENAFRECLKLVSVSMPLVETVKKNAFLGCTALTNVSMPVVTTLNNEVFSGCSKLTQATMPKVTSIGTKAFNNCSSLAQVDMSAIKTIGANGFYGCAKLVFTELNNLTTLGYSAFSGCKSLKNLSFPSLTTLSKTSAGQSTAFYNCSELVSVSMPKVTALPQGVFQGCSKLSMFNSDYPGEVVIPSSVTSIGKEAFRIANSVKTIILSKSITSMGGSEFIKATGLVNAYFPDNISSGIYNNFAGTGFTSDDFDTTINAYGSKNSYIKEFVTSDGLNTETQSGKKIYNFIEENGDLLVMDGKYTDMNGIELESGSKSVGFSARLFNTNEESTLSATAIITVVDASNTLKDVGTYELTIPAWSGMTLECDDLYVTGVNLESGDIARVMFWVNTDDNITPVVTQELKKTIDIKGNAINVLSIGNSFSQDASSYLEAIAEADGVDINAYNLHYSGRPLITHYDRLINGIADYSLHQYGKTFKTGVKSADVIDSYDWDYVILQGATHKNIYDKVLWDDSLTYNNETITSEFVLNEFKDYITEKAPNATRFFVAPWAPYNSLSASFDGGVFKNSTPDARGAYTSAILDLAKEKAAFYATDGMYLPTAVAIDYLIRYYGFDETQGEITADGKYDDTYTTTAVYRDNTCHLTNSVGRVLAGLVWYEMITGNSALENGYTNSLPEETMNKIKAAAHYACQNYASYNPADI